MQQLLQIPGLSLDQDQAQSLIHFFLIIFDANLRHVLASYYSIIVTSPGLTPEPVHCDDARGES